MSGQALKVRACVGGSLFGKAAIAAALGIAAGAAIRYGIVEPAHLGWACQVAGAPFWCPLRSGLIIALQAGSLGGIALAAALFAVFGGGRRLSGAAAALAGAALFLYGAGAGSTALVLALVRALRLPP